MSDPIISHSEITDAIYVVCGTKKYNVTEQVISAMRETGRLEQQRPHGEWIEYEDKRYCECSNCWVLVTKKEAEDFGYCPKCGSDNRPKEGE